VPADRIIKQNQGGFFMLYHSVHTQRTTIFAIVFLANVLTVLPAIQKLQAAVVSFQDSNFVSTDWTSTKYVDATVGQGASFVTSTIPTGGNPDSYRQVLLTFREGGPLRVAHLRSGSNGFKWNPSTQGAFTSIDYSFNLIMTNYFNPAPIPAPNETAQVGYSLLLYQAGHYYVAPIVVVSTNDNKQWISVSGANLQSSQFKRINLTTGVPMNGLNPDFTASGSEITFGYENATSHGSTGVFKATESGIDNYRIALNDAAPPAVPEPASAVIGLGLIAIASAKSLKRRLQRGNE
jgi:hypothetical protein